MTSRHIHGGLKKVTLSFLVSGLLITLVSCSTTPTDSSDNNEKETSSRPPIMIKTSDEALPTIPSNAPIALKASANPIDSKFRFIKTTWDDVSGWHTDTIENAWQPLLNNCQTIIAKSKSTHRSSSPSVKLNDWIKFCQLAQQESSTLKNNPKLIAGFIEKNLDPWVISSDKNTQAMSGLVTGYYEPIVFASRTKHDEFQWPLFSVPDDLLTIDLGTLFPELAGKRVRGKLEGRRIVPYDTRQELNHPERQPKAIVWVSDPIDAFFLQVQGSGRAYIADGNEKGTMIRIAYADHNGHPYASIGNWLIQTGELSAGQASMQGIKQWAKQNPNRIQELLNTNPAVVFFQEEALDAKPAGPRGAFGVPLTGQRSVAVDPQVIPLGSPLFLSTSLPNTNLPLQKLVFAQDIGAAIKGPVRIDYYWGSGDQAGDLAGKMKQTGQVWVMWPKGFGPPKAQ